MPETKSFVPDTGLWEVDLAQRELRIRGHAVTIGSRALEIIELLAKSAGRLVTKDELMQRVWPDSLVEDNTIQVHISAIRKALGSDRGMLKTVSGRGYRLLAIGIFAGEARRQSRKPKFMPGSTSNLIFQIFQVRRRL